MTESLTNGEPSFDATSLIRELRRPEAYRVRNAEIGFLQTHISLLFFAGDRVYKVKKSVDLGFLDFTTLEKRRHFCEEEVRLNRPLAPRIYLGVVAITRAPDGHLRVDGTGEPVEWAVEMARLPEAGMLEHLLEAGEIDNQRIHELVDRLARFHATAPTGPGVDEHGSPDAVRHNVEENFEQLEDLEPVPSRGGAPGLTAISVRQLGFLRSRAKSFLTTHRDLLERRVRDGHVREGHGDLHAGNVCFTDDGVVAYDCIEFNRRFRCGDVASDLAFLAMDLDFRGYPGFSRYFVKRYAKVAADADLYHLIEFYKEYRAVVRGKVGVMAAADRHLAADERERLTRSAMRYFHLAASYELGPVLILLCGLPATGKSWIAERVARSLRAVLLRSDVRRKVMSGLRPDARAGEAYGEGLYATGRKDAIYRSMLVDAVEALRSGRSSVIDATFSKRRFRMPFVDSAERLGLPYCVLHVTAAEAVVRERLERRIREAAGASDADLVVYEREREGFEPPVEVPVGHLLGLESQVQGSEAACSTLIDRLIAQVECSTTP